MNEVHDLIYHGNGGFTYHDVYNMPIQYRKFHIRKIKDYIEKQNEEVEKARGGKNTLTNPVQPSRPNVPQADFTTKAKAPRN